MSLAWYSWLCGNAVAFIHRPLHASFHVFSCSGYLEFPTEPDHRLDGFTLCAESKITGRVKQVHPYKEVNE